MSMQLAHVVANRLNMQPALVSPAHQTMIVESLRQLARADDEEEARHQEKARKDLLAAYGFESTANNKPFIYSDGVAFIPVTGLLINRFNDSWGWVTGYNFIRSWLGAAVDDPDVHSIVLDCNSGGGEVAGCFELAADIRLARAAKRCLAVVDSSSYSACYAIASAASKIVVTPSGGVGSIGVVAMHVDMSKMLSDWGINVTFIFSGDHKVDGNPYEPLPEPVRASIQARVDSTRQQFVALVAENRGLDPKVVFDTQAACYSASDALALGLIDAIAPPLEAVQAFLNELSGSDDQETEMSHATAAKPGAESTAATPENAAAAPAAKPVDSAAERAAERERIAAITTHESAKDKSALANHLALKTNLSVDEAVAILAASPAEKAAEPAKPNAFTAAMDASEHPNVGAAATGELTAAQRILASQSAATGVKH